MKEIASFNVDHTKLFPGLYVSRKDKIENVVLTTFDMRITKPYDEEVMGNGAIHTLEHLIAHSLRTDEEWGEKIVYFGPMGCRTGFDLIIAKDTNEEEIKPLLLVAIDYVINFEGQIPGATKKECGNYLENDLVGAKYYMKKYKKYVLEERKV